MQIHTDILSFSEWTTDQYRVWKDYDGRPEYEKKKDLLPETVQLLSLDSCKYCSAPLTHLAQREPLDISWRSRVDTAVSLCPLCGFWWHQSLHSTVGASTETVHVARLRSFNVGSLEAPLNAVSLHLARKPEDMYSLHPHKFEEVVGQMLKERFACSVELTKQSRDGGIDLICLDSDLGKLLVQVKRYHSKRKVTVEAIREIAGVLVRMNENRGLVVTSSSFTRDAETEVEKLRAETQRYPICIDLYSTREILCFLGVVRERAEFNVLEMPHIGDTLRYIARIERELQAQQARPEGYILASHNARIVSYLRGQSDDS